MPRFHAEDLKRLGLEFFTHVGVPADEAQLVADHMVAAGLLGHRTRFCAFPSTRTWFATGR